MTFHLENKIINISKTLLPTFLQYYLLMLVVKVSDKLQYNVGKLQKGVKVSNNIPKVVITVDKKDD